MRAVRGIAIGCALFAATVVTRGQSTATPPAAPPAATAAMPTADQILDRYVAAEGGSGTLKRLLSRVMTGTINVPSMSWSGTVEIREKAPNRSLAVILINGASYRQGFDGEAGWTDEPKYGLRDQTGAELAETRRDSDFYHTLDLHKLFSRITLKGKDKINDRDVYILEAAPPDGDPPEEMYFDVQSGLLVRTISQRHGPEGPSEYQQDYEDYREVDGVKLPFTIRQTNEGTLVIITVAEYHHNVPLDDSEFVKPAAQ